MKQTFNKSLLALVCAVGIASTPQAFAAYSGAEADPIFTRGNTAKLIIVWEILSLLHMAKKGSKADFKQRDLLDISFSLLTKNPKQWAKNAARNLEIAQSDYFEGQAYKGASLKLNHEGKLEQGKKCLPCGFNGHLLGWLASIKKASKNVEDVAKLAAALIVIRAAGTADDLKARGEFEALAKFIGWKPVEKK